MLSRPTSCFADEGSEDEKGSSLSQVSQGVRLRSSDSGSNVFSMWLQWDCFVFLIFHFMQLYFLFPPEVLPPSFFCRTALQFTAHLVYSVQAARRILPQMEVSWWIVSVRATPRGTAYASHKMPLGLNYCALVMKGHVSGAKHVRTPGLWGPSGAPLASVSPHPHRRVEMQGC